MRRPRGVVDETHELKGGGASEMEDRKEKKKEVSVTNGIRRFGFTLTRVTDIS